MVENETIESEVEVRLRVTHRAHHQVLDQLRKPKRLREREQPGVALEFHHRDRPIINFPKIRLTLGREVRLVEIENKRNGQDRDNDHEPLMVLAHYCDHRSGKSSVWAGAELTASCR